MAQRLDRELGEILSTQGSGLREVLAKSRRAEVSRAIAALVFLGLPGQADQALASEIVSAVAAWAGAGLSLGLLLRNFFVTTAVVWERLSRVVEAAPGDAIVSMRVLHDAHCVLENWLAAAAATVSDSPLRAAQARARGARLARVTDLLDGVQVDGAPLGYDLSLEHLAIVAWGDEATVAVTELAQLLGRRLFFVAAESDVAWGWLGKVGVFGRSEMRALRRFQPPAPQRAPLPAGAPARLIHVELLCGPDSVEQILVGVGKRVATRARIASTVPLLMRAPNSCSQSSTSRGG